MSILSSLVTASKNSHWDPAFVVVFIIIAVYVLIAIYKKTRK